MCSSLQESYSGRERGDEAQAWADAYRSGAWHDALVAHGVDDPALPKQEQPPFRLGEWIKGFWVSPRLYPDFGWAWITRFLMMLGNAMATLYLLFWLKDKVGLTGKEAEQGQTVLIGLYALGTILTAVVFGRLSDRSGKRKVYVISSTVVMAFSASLLFVV